MDQPLTILIADDDPDMRTYLAHCLNTAFDPSPVLLDAAHGQAALDLVTHGPCDLVLSDVRMHRLDGLSLCRILDQHDRLHRLPVLLITGESDLLDEVRAYAATRRTRAVLRKPFNARSLQTAVTELLQSSGRARSTDE